MEKKLILLCVMFLGILFAGSMHAQERGKASYYANRFHGRKTSSGEIYHKDSLTCAHKSLPFGTILKVSNPRNNKFVFVRVNDRGPFRKNRVLDLSHAAATTLELVQHGVAEIEYIPWTFYAVEKIKPINSKTFFAKIAHEATLNIRRKLDNKVISKH